ncbi:hypothetical protein [Prosthecomicrobium hirschii]|uniref:hypothetical protein n=1 Tax=Prosthecodimorpha hirschii TaxID=665126 RepID=UPI00221F4BD1|nr:hypothetical protein [Prosthecomicrobium hirschii]MCW1840442.1 hypothetical protein [Prosthecomicrobium hirschii]
MPTDATRATATALSNDPLAPRGRLSCEIDMEALRKLEMPELHAFRDVLHIIGDVLAAYTYQRRFWREDWASQLNGAGNLLDGIADLIGSYEQAAVNVAVAAKPTTADAVKCRGWTILGFEADMAGDLVPFAVLATEAVRDEAEARLLEQGAQAYPQRA